MIIKSIRLLVLPLLLSAFTIKAEVKLPAIISENMVLQQKIDAALWGWASPNEEIEIIGSWNAKSVKTKANAEGKWLVKLKTVKAGGPYTLTFNASNTIKLTNVYLGEVWLCSGQSNMEWKVAQTLGADSISKAATNSLIRMFTVQRATAEAPQEDVKGNWVITSPTSIKSFSAVAYHFGNELAMRLKVPIGLIHSSWGGTPAESWVNRDLLETDANFKPILKRYEDKVKKYNTDKVSPDPRLHYQSPGVLYNAMLKPLVNYRLKGVIWYQGESNADRAYQYRKLFPALIKSWRDDFNIKGLPFYYVQISSFKGQNPEIREAQLITLQTMDNVGMAVTADVGDCEDIHPKNKIPVGKRLAYIALHKNYNQKNVEYQSPIYSKYVIENNKVSVYFDTESKLIVKGGDLSEFTIAGADQVFYPAIAKINGKTVELYSEQVKNPVAIRFGWKNCPIIHLFNESGLPASPFRTDEWKGITEGKY